MLTKSLAFILSALTLTLPFTFWTITPNFFATPRETLLVISLLILLLAYAYDLYHKRHLLYPSSPLTLPLIIFILTITLSLIFNPEGRPEALFGKGLILLLLPLLTLLSLSTPLNLTNFFRFSFLVGTAVLALITLITLTLTPYLTFLPSYLQTQTFTPTGSFLSTLTLLILGAVLNLSFLTTTPTKNRLPLYLHLILITIASVAIVSLMLPGGVLTPVLIPYLESWSIALDALKSPRTLLFGIGLSNFSLLYSAVKPLSLNTTPLWNLTPTTSGSELLTLLATAGVLPTLTLMFIALRSLLNSERSLFTFFLGALTLCLIFTPATLTHYFLFFVTISLIVPNTPRSYALHSRQLTLIFPLLIISLSVLLATTYTRPLLAEMSIRQAQKALEKSDAQTTYQKHQKALSLAPQLSSYHLSYATLNLNLASALSQKNDLTDSDREQIAGLVQQSIQSAKNSIALKPNDPSGYLALATTYQNLINVANGAENFAIDAYAVAIRLDRANPTLRIRFAGLLTQLYQQADNPEQKANYLNRAQTELQTAIQLKNDYSNAYYNLAKLMQASNQTQNAIKALENTLLYLSPDSPDYTQAQNELNSLKSSTPLPSASPTTKTDLTTPSPLPSPLDGGPLEINNTNSP